MATTSSTSGTSSISGLVSGIDWQTMVSQLIAVDHRRVDLVTSKQTADQKKLAAWQSFNTKLLALKTSAEALKPTDSFNAFNTSMTSDSSTVKASDLLTATASTTAAAGSYEVKISDIAQAQKLSSGSFSSVSTALGSSYTGDVLINGQAVNITATDSLTNIQDKINALNSGTKPTKVVASIISYSTSDYRLVLTSQTTGATGISIANGSANDILGSLGITAAASADYSVKNAVTGGAQSDAFTGVNQTITQLLGLNSAASSTTLKLRDASGTETGNISVDLSSMDLNAIRDAINNNKGTANITASVKTQVVDGTTSYRLQIDGLQGTNAFEDSNNIFQTLGFTKGTVSDVVGVTGSNAMTTGGTAISSTTLLSAIDGYTNWTSGDHIDFTGKNTSGAAVTQSFTINQTSTVQDLLSAIQSAYGNVSASVTGDGKIRITDLTTSTTKDLSVTMASTVASGSLDFGLSSATDTTIRKRQITAGQDASLTIDGVSVTRTSNTITDVIGGVTLNLLKGDAGTTVNLQVDRDVSSIKSKIQSFVDSYNTVSSYITTQQTYDAANKTTGGVLFGDGTLSSIKDDLTKTLIGTVWGSASDLPSLGLIGVNLDDKGKLSIDDTLLTTNLQTRFNDVQALFSTKAALSSGALQYVDSGSKTNPGQYDVNITQASTQSSATSETAVATTLGAAETLSVTESGKTASVALTSAMSMSDIVNALNTEFGVSYTQTLTGSDALYSDAGLTTKITNNTTWNNVYKSTGVSAGLAAGDVISFSGTNRAGTSVSGSYTINNTSTDTVEGLLTAVEQAYGTNYSAQIGSDGKLIVADKQTGNSSLALSFDTTSAHSLSFGTVETGNTGGQKGRYALSLTAAQDASNHLVITHKDYGSTNTFSVSETSDLLWTSGDQTASNGKDVAGTINGKTATGAGQVLTGASGQTGIEGLVIKYTGTTTGIVGNIKLTMGVGELFNRALEQITDSTNGYLTVKTNSLQDEIDSYTKQISEMEARLSRKMDMLMAQYSAMETALSKIKNQGSWLTSQITALSNTSN